MPHALGLLESGPTFDEIARVLTLRGGFNTSAVVLASTLFGLAAGVVGMFALLRKRSLVADALSHATLPGIGLAFLFAAALGFDSRSLAVLLGGGAATAFLGVLTIQALVRHTRLTEDAAIGIVLSVFFGAGIVVLSVVQATGGGAAAGLTHLIYGQTAAMTMRDASVMAAIAAVTLVAAVTMYKEFALVSFNDSFARVGGLSVGVIDTVMMGLVLTVTVAGLPAVGLLMVVAMLIIPAVAARFWSERLWVVVVLAGAIGAASGYTGSVLSSLLPRQPAGAVIVLTAGAFFVLSMVFAPSRGVIAAVSRRMRFRLRIAGDHALELAYERWREDGGIVGLLTVPDLESLAKHRAWPIWLRWWIRGSLWRRGYVELGTNELRVTSRGLSRGARVHRNHALWAQYLVSAADIAPSHVDWSVDQVEHVLSEELIRQLEDALRARGVYVADPAMIGEGA